MNSQDSDKVCKFCGKPKDPIKYVFNAKGEEKTFVVGYVCNCEKATKAREEAAKAKAEAEEVERLKALKSKCLAQGIKPHFIGSKEGAEYVERALEGGLYIVGDTGTGKTHLASGIAKRCAMADKSFKFTSTLEIMLALRDTFHTSQQESELLGGLCACGVLFLDDLGKEYPTDYMLEKLFYIVNRRYEYDRPIVVTSQFERDELAQRLAKNGDKETAIAIVRRLQDMCGDVVRLETTRALKARAVSHNRVSRR